MSSKIYHSNANKDRLVCGKTYRLFQTILKLGLTIKVPIREVFMPCTADGVMLDKFFMTYVRVDNE